MYPQTKEDAIHYIYYIHFCLSNLTYYNKNMFNSEESLIEDFSFKTLILNKWKVNILSNQSIELLFEFRKEWLKLKKKVNYAEDYFFLYYNSEWNLLIEKYLLPALDSIEVEMVVNEIDFVPYKSHRNINARPSNEDVLERGSTLFGLLLKYGIIEKRYMD